MLKRHHQVYIAIVLLSMALMTFQSRQGVLRPLWFMPSALNNMNSSITYIKQGLGTFLRVATLNEQELAELRKDNLRLRTEAADYDRLRLENQRLREVLEFADRTPDVVAVARIISRGSNQAARTVVIDKGKRHGLLKDMAVIVPEGLAGKVMQAEDAYASVLLVDDSMFSAAVRMEQSRVSAVYTGHGRGRGVLKYVSTDQPLEPDDKLVTSGLDGLFPPGIAVGRVNSVTTDFKELFHGATVVPSVDTRMLEEVVIVSR